MVDGDILELVWEDGQIVMRGRSMTPSCISYSYSHPSPNSQLANKKDTYNYRHPAKTPPCNNNNMSGDHQPPSLDLPGVAKLGNSPTPAGGNNIPSRDGLASSRIKQVDSSSTGGSSKHSEFRNFSLFLRPGLLLKTYGGTNCDTRTATGPSSLRLEELKPSNNELSGPSGTQRPIESSVMVPSCRPNCAPDQVLNSSKTVEKPLEEPPPPDQQSEALVNRIGIRSNDKYINGGQVEGPRLLSSEAERAKRRPLYSASKLPAGHQLAGTSSACSQGASNDVEYSLRNNRHEENERIAYASEDGEEEEEPTALTKAGAKRKRNAQGHSVSEKKRREKINKRLRELQHLLPNSNKVDKASLLDDAIAYIKTLQLQLLMMSVGPVFYNNIPQMMLQAPQLTPLLHPPIAMAFAPNLPPRCISAQTPPVLGISGQMLTPLQASSGGTSIPLFGGQPPVPVPGVSSMDLSVPAPLMVGLKDQSHQINLSMKNNNGKPTGS